MSAVNFNKCEYDICIFSYRDFGRFIAIIRTGHWLMLWQWLHVAFWPPESWFAFFRAWSLSCRRIFSVFHRAVFQFFLWKIHQAFSPGIKNFQQLKTHWVKYGNWNTKNPIFSFRSLEGSLDDFAGDWPLHVEFTLYNQYPSSKEYTRAWFATAALSLRINESPWVMVNTHCFQYSFFYGVVEKLVDVSFASNRRADWFSSFPLIIPNGSTSTCFSFAGKKSSGWWW